MDTELGRGDEQESRNLLDADGGRPHPIGTWLFSRFRALRRPVVRHRPLVILLLLLAVKYVVPALLVIFILTPFLAPSYTHLPPHYRHLEERCRGPSPASGCANPHAEKVFIAAILYDKDGQLAGGRWGQRVLTLIHLLGPENVFLSIYENDSGPAGRAALNEFERAVPCRHRLVSDEHVSLAAFPNVTLPDGRQRTKRVAYLSELRNRALRPLDEFRESAGIVKYDKVLFLNDIAFAPLDAAHLLFNTNRRPAGPAPDPAHKPNHDGDRASYVAACAVDYFHPLRIYDVYALRDAEGHANYQTLYSFFANRGRATSRHDVLAQTDAVHVRSCWGGMMAMRAEYVQNLERDAPSPAFGKIAGHVIDPDRPRNVTAPVRFRHEPGAYYDACECCLFSADLAAVARRAGAIETGIYVNPFVRVAYNERVLSWLPVARRWERLLALAYAFQSWFTPLADNPYRTVAEGEPFREEVWDNDGKDGKSGNGGRWRLVERVGRSGLFCGIRDMQILRKPGARPGKMTGNWVNTRFPPGQALQFRSWWGRELPVGWRGAYAATADDEKDFFFEFE